MARFAATVVATVTVLTLARSVARAEASPVVPPSRLLGTNESALGQSAGLEVFLHRDFTERLGGFVSYTLSRTVSTSSGITERVSWDRTHVLSVVLGYDLGRGWRVGSRLFLESGRPFEAVCVEHCSGSSGQSPILYTPPGKLPAFWRLLATSTFPEGAWRSPTRARSFCPA